MKLLALDPAIRCGYCIGRGDGKVFSSSVLLIRKGESVEQLPTNAAAWLSELIERERPDWIAMESWAIHNYHFKNEKGEQVSGTNNNAVRTAGYLQGAFRGEAGRHGITVSCVDVNVWRKSFCGKAIAGRAPNGSTSKQKATAREANKRMALDRAIMLGMLPRGCEDRDAGDACGIYAHTLIEHNLEKPGPLVLFGT